MNLFLKSFSSSSPALGCSGLAIVDPLVFSALYVVEYIFAQQSTHLYLQLLELWPGALVVALPPGTHGACCSGGC